MSFRIKSKSNPVPKQLVIPEKKKERLAFLKKMMEQEEMEKNRPKGSDSDGMAVRQIKISQDEMLNRPKGGDGGGMAMRRIRNNEDYL